MSERSLDRELSHLIYQFIVSLEKYYWIHNKNKTLSEIQGLAKNKLHEIIDQSSSVANQYNSLLSWCEVSEEGDTYFVVKDGFNRRHKNYFQSRTLKIANNQEKRVKEHRLLAQELRTKIEDDLEVLDNQFKSIAIFNQNLLNNINDVKKIDFKANLDDATYQAAVNQLKKHATKIREEVRTVPSYRKFNSVELYTCPPIRESGQQELLSKLDKSIAQYKRDLAHESKFTKLVNFFSLARHRRTRALQEYTNSVASKANDKDKYAAATEWFYKHINQSKDFLSGEGRFSTTCMLPFQRNLDQYRFETIGMINRPLQGEINRLIDANQNTIIHHNERLRQQNEMQQLLHSNATKTYQALSNVCDIIEKIPDVGNFGYGRNHALEVENALKKLNETVGINQGQNVEASSVVNKILQVKTDTTSAEIKNIAKEANIITDEKKEEVIQCVSQVIAETALFGGRANVRTFMGATKAAAVVNAIGNDEQKRIFKETKIKADAIAKETFATLEMDLVIQLRRALETKSLISHLQGLRILYLKHKQLEGHVRDAQSEALYHQKFRSEREMASGLHLHGNGELAAFIDEVLAATVRAEGYHTQVKTNYLESLSFDCIDTLAIIYGTDKQYQKWVVYKETLNKEKELKLEDQSTAGVFRR